MTLHVDDGLPLQKLGWVLVHFLWQGVLIGLLSWAVLRLSQVSAKLRYLLLCAALGLCVLAPVMTWNSIGSKADKVAFSAVPNRIEPAATSAVESRGGNASATAPIAVQSVSTWEMAQDEMAAKIRPFLPVLVDLWSVGVLLLAFRLAWGWQRLGQVLAGAVPVGDQAWLEALEGLRRRMGVSRPVRLLHSAWVEVPTLIGWMRPTLLVPVSFFTGLPAAQIEALFAHELAHVIRHDFLINLVQIGVETLLFYHPVVWWIGKELREAREECCDDLAIEAVRNRREYVVALASLEELRATAFPGVLSARGGSLLRRLQRLAAPSEISSGRGRFIGMLLAVAFGLLAVCGVGLFHAGKGEGPSLRGTLVDQAGKPLPGAEVRICEMEGKPHAAVSPRDHSGDFKKVAHTDLRGRFILSDLSPSSRLVLIATAPGYGPDFIEGIDPEAGPIEAMLFKLSDGSQGGVARGHVSDPNGVPIAGARVSPDGYFWNDSWSNGAAGDMTAVATDANGDFSLPLTWNDQAANQGVGGVIAASGFAPIRFSRLPYNDQPRSFALNRGVEVTGRLLLEGHPVGNVAVGIQTDDFSRDVGEMTAVTDGYGRFVLPNVAANDTCRIYGKRDSLHLYGATREKIIRTGAPGTLTDAGAIEVFPGRTVTGRILLSDGKTLRTSPQLQILFYSGAKDRFHLDLGLDGRFEFRAFDGEKLGLYSWVSGYRSRLPNATDITVSADLKPLELLYDPTSISMTGQIVLTDGKQLSRPVFVVLRHVGSTGPGEGMRADSNGRFEFQAAPGDLCTFTADIPGYQPAPFKPVANGTDVLTITPNSHEVRLNFDPVPTSSVDTAPPTSDTLQVLLNHAELAARQGKNQEALADFLQFQEQSKGVAGMRGVRLSFSLGYWMDLAKHYPPAMEAYLRIRGDDGRRLLAGDADPLLFKEYVSMNDNLHDEDATYSLFMKIHQSNSSLAQTFFDENLVETALANHHEYTLCSTYLPDAMAAFGRISSLREQLLEFPRTHPDSKGNESLTKISNDRFVKKSLELITILTKAGRKSEAEQVRAKADLTVDVPELRSS